MNRGAALAGQTRAISWGRRGAGGRLGERACSAWSRTSNRGRGRGERGAGGDHFEGWEKAAGRGWSRGAGGFSDLTFIFRRVHLTLFGGRVDRDGVRRGAIVLWAFGAGRARRFSGGMVTPAGGTVRGVGGTAVGDRAKVTLLGAGRIGAAVFSLLVM